ncbi:MAG: hypothetical protein CMO80_23020 [Verrucomicrobiales bacterium]|nr:hypothetical protein [Verrucomicrobiales bacterium]
MAPHRSYLAYWSSIVAGLCAMLLGQSLEANVPAKVSRFLDEHCLDCHDAGIQKGEINLEFTKIDWSDKNNLALWERVLNVLESGEMPPKKKRQPKSDLRKEIVRWIDGKLTRHTPIGGTLARRLNQAEYRMTMQKLFGIGGFKLPPGFPADREHHGFDNLGEGLVLSPPLLQAYAETARIAADVIYPPVRKAPKPSTQTAQAKDLVISYSSSKLVNGAMRLGMKCDPIQRSCTWPSRIEADASGVYRFKVSLSAFRGESEPMIAKVLARDVSSSDSISHKALRLLKEIEVAHEAPKAYEFEAELFEGQTIVLHWVNATLDSDRADKADLQEFFRNKGMANPRYLAAWNAMLKSEKGQGFRGGIGWERVKEQLAREDLPELSEKERAALLKKIAGNPVLYAETVVFDVFENGPALEIHGVTVEGPVRVIEGPNERKSRNLRKLFAGEEDEPANIIRNFLTRAFRRSVDDAVVDSYIRLHNRHLAAGHTAHEAMHLVIRKALISPRFLYRCLHDGPLDDHDLATRLSYFLTGGPPDRKLLSIAAAGRMTEVLRKEAERLLPRRPGEHFVVNFIGQWLDTRLLPEIMPDPRFKFSAADAQSAKSEVEHLFSEILRENRPMTDFIDPDFTWTSARLAQNVYGLRSGFDKRKKYTIHRVELLRGGRFGGVLGNPAVMMATANGVDTQPVIRGVWVLENIMGTPPPPPPKAVPALTPDTRGTTTPRELLSAHTKEISCAGCHRKIDPVGFVLENFDPVGRWRDEWPGIKQRIDASSMLHDGTKIRDIVDFKAWLLKNIDQFSQCLAEKLMTYATGRIPNYSERKEIAAIVKTNRENGNGFRDLLLALIESESFRTK